MEVISIIRIIVNRSSFSKRQLHCTLMFVILTLMGIMAQLAIQKFFGERVLLGFPAIGVSLMVLLFAYETPDYRKLMEMTKERNPNYIVKFYYNPETGGVAFSPSSRSSAPVRLSPYIRSVQL